MARINQNNPGPATPQKIAMSVIQKYYIDTDESYSKEEFLAMIKSMSPSKRHLEYKLSKSLDLLALNPSKEEYDMLVEMYAFRFYFGHSVITMESLNKLVQFIGKSKVLEIGAGNGYTGRALQLSGIDVTLTDIPNNIYPCLQMFDKKPWTEIIYMDNISALNKYVDCDCLLMIWPPPGILMAYDSIKLFKGSKFIYIGEWSGGQNGTSDFFSELDKNWNIIEKVNVPNFMATSDSIYLFTRK